MTMKRERQAIQHIAILCEKLGIKMTQEEVEILQRHASLEDLKEMKLKLEQKLANK